MRIWESSARQDHNLLSRSCSVWSHRWSAGIDYLSLTRLLVSPIQAARRVLEDVCTHLLSVCDVGGSGHLRTHV